MKIAVLALFLLAGCSSMSSSSEPVNKTCPVSAEELGSKAVNVEYGGETVALCCKGCKGDWDSMSDEEKKQALASAR